LLEYDSQATIQEVQIFVEEEYDIAVHPTTIQVTSVDFETVALDRRAADQATQRVDNVFLLTLIPCVASQLRISLCVWPLATLRSICV